MVDNRQIGVIDSGVGGLTVAREFRKLLPRENIIYFGDNENVPYGNKTEEEIYRLTKHMIDYLMEKDVKLIAVACNTISAILDKYFLDSKIPIVSIIEPTVDYVIREKLQNIGVLATKFTIKSRVYEKKLRSKNENINIVSESCPVLAKVIDGGCYKEEIQNIIELHMSNIFKKYNIEDIILGCTHYPIVLDAFKRIGPNINFINPAYEQVMYIKRLMEEGNIEGEVEDSTFEIYTTGDEKIYFNIIHNLLMELPDKIQKVKL